MCRKERQGRADGNVQRKCDGKVSNSRQPACLTDIKSSERGRRNKHLRLLLNRAKFLQYMSVRFRPVHTSGSDFHCSSSVVWTMQSLHYSCTTL